MPTSVDVLSNAWRFGMAVELWVLICRWTDWPRKVETSLEMQILDAWTVVDDVWRVIG